MPITLPQFTPADESVFRGRYRHLTTLLDRPYLNLWGTLNTPEAFVFMYTATVAHHLPAVAGIAWYMTGILSQVDDSERDYVKQAIGAITCAVMESNGFEKTGTKKAVPPIPERVFRRAELYRRA